MKPLLIKILTQDLSIVCSAKTGGAVSDDSLKKMTNDGNLFSFIFFINSIYTSD